MRRQSVTAQTGSSTLTTANTLPPPDRGFLRPDTFYQLGVAKYIDLQWYFLILLHIFIQYDMATFSVHIRIIEGWSPPDKDEGETLSRHVIRFLQRRVFLKPI